MISKYKQHREYNTEGGKIEVFEAGEAINTIKNFINNFEGEHNEKLELEKEIVVSKRM